MFSVAPLAISIKIFFSKKRAKLSYFLLTYSKFKLFTISPTTYSGS